MTSSVLDGAAGCESPAPPAFSPLTDPADPGNREPSVLPGADGETTVPEPAARVARHDDTAAANGLGPPPDINPDSHAEHASTTTPPTAPAAPPEPTAMDDGAMHLDSPMDGAAVDYTTSPALDLFSLMALARMSAASQQSRPVMLPPSTVRPSQVSLPPHPMLDASDSLMHDAPDPSHQAPPPDASLESFARIEFADSVFQMTTYAVIIGRDQRALDQARRDERRLEEYQRRVRENEQLGLPPPSPPTQDRGRFSKSYVSEEGGMLGPESDGDDNPRPAKRKKTSGGAASASGDSQQQDAAAASELAGQEEKNAILNRQYVSHTPGAAAVNLSALRPSPYYVPFIGIHSPGPNIASRTKAISREHLKIQFNQKEGVFEAIPLHKNGFFCEDVHYRDQKVVLRSGDRLQIKDVDFVFVINGVPRGKTGAEDAMDEDGASSRRYSEGGKEMSFDFESSHDPERRSTSPDEVAAGAANKDDSDSELSEPAEDVPEPEPEQEAPPQEIMETIEKDSEAPPPHGPPRVKPETDLELLASLPPILPRKRGPGRPPKNGIMSKREERLRKKAAMELAKKNMPPPPPGDPPVKRKVGRPRKHPLPENAPDRPEKRKYKPRKSKNGEEGDGSDPEKTLKERRREKPKTPPLELNREDYTEEQLQKPPKNYGMLIDEVLSAAPEGLTLKQIYKRIQMKYPFYYFTVDTKGWESSVRHNLIGNDAFRKNEETHLWSRVPGIDIDAGKKRKATSPDRPASMHAFGQPYSASATPAPQMFHAEAGPQQAYRPGSASQRTGYPPGQGQMALGQHPQPHAGVHAGSVSTQQPPRQAYPSTAHGHGSVPAQSLADHQAAARPAQAGGGAQVPPYSSPYASRPLPADAMHQGGVPQAAARPTHMPSPANGLPRGGAPSAQGATPAAIGARPGQPASGTGTLALKPAVAPELVRHVTNFKTTVTEQLTKRTSAAEAVAMSVINRGLGLAAESTIPEEESLEKIVLGVFESSRKNLGANQSLHPGLVQSLVNFKNSMIKTLEPRMGKLNAERLILSAVDRVLGFADRSTMPGTESDRKQYDEAETVLIPAIQRVVTEHQRTLAVVASVSTPQPASRPPSSAPAAAPGSLALSAKGSAHPPGPPVAGVSSTTATPHPGPKPPQSAGMPTNSAAGSGSARPQPLPVPPAQATRPAATPASPQPALPAYQTQASAQTTPAPLAGHPRALPPASAASQQPLQTSAHGAPQPPVQAAAQHAVSALAQNPSNAQIPPAGQSAHQKPAQAPAASAAVPHSTPSQSLSPSAPPTGPATAAIPKPVAPAPASATAQAPAQQRPVPGPPATTQTGQPSSPTPGSAAAPSKVSNQERDATVGAAPPNAQASPAGALAATNENSFQSTPARVQGVAQPVSSALNPAPTQTPAPTPTPAPAPSLAAPSAPSPSQAPAQKPASTASVANLATATNTPPPTAPPPQAATTAAR